MCYRDVCGTLSSEEGVCARGVCMCVCARGVCVCVCVSCHYSHTHASCTRQLPERVDHGVAGVGHAHDAVGQLTRVDTPGDFKA